MESWYIPLNVQRSLTSLVILGSGKKMKFPLLKIDVITCWYNYLVTNYSHPRNTSQHSWCAKYLNSQDGAFFSLTRYANGHISPISHNLVLGPLPSQFSRRCIFLIDEVCRWIYFTDLSPSCVRLYAIMWKWQNWKNQIQS